jgi:hypothetical protein
MLVVTKNKRSQLLFRRPPEGDQPPDIVLERPLVLESAPTAVLADKVEIEVGGALVCTVENDLKVSLETDLVLSLVCDKED